MVAAALVCVLLCGCTPLVLLGVGAAGGVTGVKYYEGALTAVFQAPFEVMQRRMHRIRRQIRLRTSTPDHYAAGKPVFLFEPNNIIFESFNQFQV